MTVTILGAGLAGLSCSYFIGHENCLIFERNQYEGGHIATHVRDECFWDEGPHVSFTKHSEVRDLLTWSASGSVLEYPTNVANSYHGHWIPHPAQSNLGSVPEPLARQCFDDFLASRVQTDMQESDGPPLHYGEWLERAFGPTFAKTFPTAYTQKYWTCHPDDMTVDWVGERVYYPDVATVEEGYIGVTSKNTHYITSVRYPESGGYMSFACGIKNGANLILGKEVVSIDLASHRISFSDGTDHSYEALINTMPLDKFVKMIRHAPSNIVNSAQALNCSSLLLVNIRASGPTRLPYHWLYVYDQNMYSTRISQTQLLSPRNTPSGSIGIQVEVYASRYRPFSQGYDEIAKQVVSEVLQLGLATEIEVVSTQYVPYANIIFDHHRRDNQNAILDWLSGFGLEREEDDLDPMTDWGKAKSKRPQGINLAGRFGQWKYFWTDDCILRGKQFGPA
ncbi:NAD(P)-binding protein [Synechococcus sp. J7-Johnson]|uniref:protoporphyrinogen/coproporphyrinogen oxidase n=1 Tax=Synechococcus sp. J7-Johnson TaxID=2823737 RepID=UPI0020CF09C3|nr:NAD(P)-binding protein [Synechococcus sp. J7-Johnson]MCP9841963.1 NAD(P)-binding protein [Synechococcus sp. J7-Johnson]